jgi:regulatory protein
MTTSTDDELYQQLISSSFRFLSVRLRSEKEMTVFLSKKATAKAIPADVVSRVVLRLKELDYINDQKFAQMLISSRIHGKPKGERVIRQELEQKGVDKAIINAQIQDSLELADDTVVRELAIKALGKKLARYVTLKPQECSRKVYDFVVRRGFSANIARALVDDYCKKAYNRD